MQCVELESRTLDLGWVDRKTGEMDQSDVEYSMGEEDQKVEEDKSDDKETVYKLRSPPELKVIA